MNEGHGALITFEGGDGSGKGTQTELTYQWLLEQGLPVRKGGFPMYDTPTGKLVADYLNGKLGRDVSAEEAGLLFQNDRKANKGPVDEWVQQGGIMLLDRYVESNSGHQGGKLPSEAERVRYITENARIEYEENGLRIPDLSVLFTLAPELAQEYVARKTAASRANYTTASHDIHEDDPLHLANANEAFMLLPELYPDRFRHIDITAENGREMRSREEIQEHVRAAIRPLLVYRGYTLNV